MYLCCYGGGTCMFVALFHMTLYNHYNVGRRSVQSSILKMLDNGITHKSDG